MRRDRLVLGPLYVNSDGTNHFPNGTCEVTSLSGSQPARDKSENTLSTKEKMVTQVQKNKDNSEGRLLPIEAKERKAIPLASGVLDYFAQALIEVAKVSFHGNQQHNPGQPLHWSRGKSPDHADTMLRHFVERGTFDADGIRHSAKMAWRALAILQLELEVAGAPIARGAVVEGGSLKRN